MAKNIYAGLKQLGKEAAIPASPEAALLERVANPHAGTDYLVRFTAPEFTSLCPMTGQPDFAQFQLEYVPDSKCVELKSLKLYLWSFRDRGAFHEAVTNQILEHLAGATQPRFMRLTAKWNVRGGIYTSVVVEHRQPEWTPAPSVMLP